MSQLATRPPLILTLRMDSQSQEFFNAFRKTYFPPERNYLDAHLTLFHHLNDNDQTLATVKSIAQPAFTLKTTGMKFLGAGVAFAIESKELHNIRKELAIQLHEQLIPQDKQGYRPHITIQNKVSPEAAKQLLNELQSTFQPITITARGLDLWQYLGGPWKHHAYHALGPAPG